MPSAEVIASYHDPWHVEQSFRMSKTDLAARPILPAPARPSTLTPTVVCRLRAFRAPSKTALAPSLRRFLRTLKLLRSGYDRDQRRQTTRQPSNPKSRPSAALQQPATKASSPMVQLRGDQI